MGGTWLPVVRIVRTPSSPPTPLNRLPCRFALPSGRAGASFQVPPVNEKTSPCGEV